MAASSASESVRSAPVGRARKVRAPPASPTEVTISRADPHLRGRLVFCAQDDINTDGIFAGAHTYKHDMTQARHAAIRVVACSGRRRWPRALERLRAPRRVDSDAPHPSQEELASVLMENYDLSLPAPCSGDVVVRHNFGCGSSRSRPPPPSSRRACA